MSARAAQMKSRQYPNRVAKLPGKARLLTLGHLDGRTLAAKRTAEIIRALTTDLGGDLTESERQLVQHAAVLGSFIENTGARFVADGEVDIGALTSAVNAQRRLLATLGLSRRATYHTGSSEYLRGTQRAGEGVDLDAQADFDAFKNERRRLSSDVAP